MLRILTGYILEAPIYLHSHHSEKVKQRFTSKATVAKQLFSEVLQHWSSILLVPPNGLRIDMNSILPGFSKGGMQGIPCLPFSTNQRSILYSFGLLDSEAFYFSFLKKKKKDTSWDHRFPVHQGKGQFCFEKHHRGLDEMLAESECHFLTVEVWKRRQCRKWAFMKFRWETQIIYHYKETKVHCYRCLVVKKISFKLFPI